VHLCGLAFSILIKAMTLQYGINRSKCIKDYEIPCEKEVHLSVLVEKEQLLSK